MQKISCPCCGGEVIFRSSASVMAVCEYCSSTLLKDAESVKDIGKVSEVLEDFSPIQINTSGIYKGNNFAVVGRIQLRYEAGFWNEWHILFDDGSSGWLSDASGQYILTLPRPMPGAPAFQEIKPGSRYVFAGSDFFASDVRTSRCISWSGELPFRVGTEWEAKAADFRSGTQFLTLDYSDGVVPQLYVGQAVTLEELQCQLLRDADAVTEASGKFKGKPVALDCPSCGSSIKYLAGMALHIVCPSCHAEVDCSADKAVVLQKAEEIARVTTTLTLGDVGTIDGTKYEAIGLMQCQAADDESSSTWVEYLLFNAGKGFLWLVESDQGWDQVTVLNEWPQQWIGSTAAFHGEKFNKMEAYDSTVLYAAGTFNWRVSIGDRTHITDYQKGNRKLSAERNDSEVVWTSSKRVPASDVMLWFGKAKSKDGKEKAAALGPAISSKAAIIYSILIAILNVPISFASGMHGIKIILGALVILWIPVLISRFFNKDS